MILSKAFLSAGDNYKSGDIMDYVEKKIEHLEMEIKELKKLVKSNKKKHISFSGMAKTKLSEKQLDEEIRKAKKSLFGGGDV